MCLLSVFNFTYRLERSTDQVIKPINLEALSKWVGEIPKDVVRDMHNIAPMLSILGYDPLANPPNYGRPDSFVVHKMQELEVNKEIWSAKETKLKQIRESIRSSLVKHGASNKADANDAETNQINDSEKTKNFDANQT